MKKIYRILVKFLGYILISIISKILKKFSFIITPQLNKVDILIDTTLATTKLCDIGKKYGTNKSPINLKGHRIGYTALYSLLFSQIKNKRINFAEIGIAKNASIKMWREYFSQANIYAFEYDDQKITSALKDKLSKTLYLKIDVQNDKSINESFYKAKLKFDVIVDDSTHNFEDQIRIIKNCHKFLNPGGVLIIEDIFKHRKHNKEIYYYYKLKNFTKFFDEFFLSTQNMLIILPPIIDVKKF